MLLRDDICFHLSKSKLDLFCSCGKHDTHKKTNLLFKNNFVEGCRISVVPLVNF